MNEEQLEQAATELDAKIIDFMWGDSFEIPDAVLVEFNGKKFWYDRDHSININPDIIE